MQRVRNLKFSRCAFLSGLGLVLLIVVFSSCGSLSAGKIDLFTGEADFGTISNSDPVTKTFEIRNSGAGNLTINGLSTSCSCTTAVVSKSFLEPGETVELSITFDPGAHNGATGKFMRQIFIESTDPETPRAVFTMWITVVEM